MRSIILLNIGKIVMGPLLVSSLRRRLLSESAAQARLLRAVASLHLKRRIM